MTDRELMHQALNALEYASDQSKPEGLYGCDCLICKTILALRDRLSKPHIKVEGPMHVVCQCDKCKTQRHWVDLTRAEFAEILCDDRLRGKTELMLLQTQAKLKEKNGG